MASIEREFPLWTIVCKINLLCFKNSLKSISILTLVRLILTTEWSKRKRAKLALLQRLDSPPQRTIPVSFLLLFCDHSKISQFYDLEKAETMRVFIIGGYRWRELRLSAPL
jgi:hypothetical protein